MISVVATRNRLLLTAALLGLDACSEQAGPEPLLTAAIVAASDGQTGLPGKNLPLPLRVSVAADGRPKAGASVTWAGSAGSFEPPASLTDASGVAAAMWTLGGVPGAMVATATVVGAQGSPVTFTATALEPVAATAVESTNGQTGVAGRVLPMPLRVRVQLHAGGYPAIGRAITWRTSTGSLAAVSAVTDSLGIATAAWTLGTTAGPQTAYADATEAQVTTAAFTATAVAGPAEAIEKVAGDGQTAGANRPAFNEPLMVVIRDRYGNAVEGKAITWTVVSGPVTLSGTDVVTNATGRTSARPAPSGEEGNAVVQAALSNGSRSVRFALTIGPPEHIVLLDPYASTHPGFISTQNGSTNPAVDTIPVGATMQWFLSPFDYGQHGLTPVGSPAFGASRDFPYAFPSTISVTFRLHGTYRYADPYFSSATGVLVVR